MSVDTLSPSPLCISLSIGKSGCQTNSYRLFEIFNQVAKQSESIINVSARCWNVNALNYLKSEEFTFRIRMQLHHDSLKLFFITDKLSNQARLPLQLPQQYKSTTQQNQLIDQLMSEFKIDHTTWLLTRVPESEKMLYKQAWILSQAISSQLLSKLGKLMSEPTQQNVEQLNMGEVFQIDNLQKAFQAYKGAEEPLCLNDIKMQLESFKSLISRFARLISSVDSHYQITQYLNNICIKTLMPLVDRSNIHHTQLHSFHQFITELREIISLTNA
ncbi:MAG: hypothetical protein ACPGUD_10160 [Parashewanella sp.]